MGQTGLRGARTARRGAEIAFNRTGLSDNQLLDLYRAILKPRMIEEKMLNLLRQGKISKWFSGIGQEAIAVGATKALRDDEYILPMHRNLGVFTTRGIPLAKLFAQLQGKRSGFSKGRERSFHFGTNAYHIVGMISHLGPQMGVADGIALACKLSGEPSATIVFTGEGGTSQGDFHEALNVAAVWDLPVIFLIENNGYGLSTPTVEQYKCSSLADRGVGYGIEAKTIDGNNILEVYSTIDSIAKEIRMSPRPFLLECMTFRMRGHEEASGTKYVPKELMEQWAVRDPVKNYEQFLLDEGVLTEVLIENSRGEFTKEIQDGLDVAFSEEPPVPDTEEELRDVYASDIAVIASPKGEAISSTKKIASVASLPRNDEVVDLRFVDAISDGLREAMKQHPNLILMGQDIAEYGGVFKVTEGFVEEFGRERVRNTPLCESAIIGAGLGLSVKGWKSVIEMQFADFVTSGFNQVVNNLAKIHWRWGQNADVVIRMPAGAGVGAGPFHSQSNEAWFTHTPGLKVVYPSNPHDAKGLLIASIEDPNPVMFFEHKALYRSLKSAVASGYYTEEIGKAKLLRQGEDVSIITYGMGVVWAQDLLERWSSISPSFGGGRGEAGADLLDLRTLQPLDYDAIATSVKKTGKVLILHEDVLFGGIGGEIAAWITENCFEHLDAPVMRVASLDTPVPFAETLEKDFLAASRLEETLKRLLEY